jgi:hypothetical protein
MSDSADHATPHSAEVMVKALKTPKIQRSRTDAIYKPAIQRHQQRQRQQVSARDPLDRCQRAVQIHSQAGQRDVHHGRVNLR